MLYMMFFEWAVVGSSWNSTFPLVNEVLDYATKNSPCGLADILFN